MKELMLAAEVLTKVQGFLMVLATAQQEGRKVSADDVERFRDSLLESDSELEAAIAQRKAEEEQENG